MKFRLTASRKHSPVVEVRVEVMGRFGNYIFSRGWISGPDKDRVSVEYQFPDSERATAPEYAFVLRASSDEARINFLHLFWVNNAYKLELGPHCAVIVSAKGDNKESVAGSCEVTELLHSDLEALLAALKAAENKGIWGNRIVLEMIKRGSLDDRAGFNAVALDQVGWQTMDAAVRKHLEPRSEGERVRDYLDFLCQCISNTPASSLPTPLREKFISAIENLDVTEGDRDLANLAIHQLARVEPELAREFAHSIITTIPCDRRELATILRHCFPKNSQWWTHHALSNPELGAEQAADALNCAGTAAATQGQPALAALSYEAALLVNPLAQSVAWNAGWCWAGVGDFERAGKCFKRINRHYTHTSLSTRWPHIHGLPWPVEPMDAGQFALPSHVTSWPRITVVTPSYNQGCYIEETLLSVLNQGYPNLQYIVVDGNSTDETRQVLERYRDRLDHLIIEPDKGQTEAINKGLRLADGQLIAWLNSDDMYAPGALHQAALKWLESDADVIAGICIEHAARNMMLFNKPHARNTEFNPPQLARIFKYWLKGYYFYQPEVFFSKRILDKVGLLDESLYYSMDYDLWMRFSKAGAALAVVDWPFAFFRKHAEQKTTRLIDCLEEQAQVRSRHHELTPSDERLHQIRRSLDALRRKEKIKVAVLLKQMERKFSGQIQQELDLFCLPDTTCHLCRDERDPFLTEADLVILPVYLQSELELIESLRATAPDTLIFGWFWRSADDPFENHSVAQAADVVLSGQADCGQYLRSDAAIHGGYLPTSVTQWARQNAETWFNEFDGSSRNQPLHCPFVDESHDTESALTLRRLIEALSAPAISMISRENYELDLVHTGKERFAQSCRFQTALVPPGRDELLERIYEALLAGQIPLVPASENALDLMFPREVQESLPIIRFRAGDAADFKEAYQNSAASIKKEGDDGARRRHAYALENGMFSSRINDMLMRFVCNSELENMVDFNNPAQSVTSGPRVSMNPIKSQTLE